MLKFLKDIQEIITKRILLSLKEIREVLILFYITVYICVKFYLDFIVDYMLHYMHINLIILTQY